MFFSVFVVAVVLLLDVTQEVKSNKNPMFHTVLV